LPKPVDGCLIKFQDKFICIQSLEKMLKGAKRKFFLKNSIWALKNAEFHADFKFVANFFLKSTKKVINKNVMEICTFSSLTHVLKIV
jgi:hypothetical protein